MQLVHHSEWKSRRKFLCGSTIELPNNSIIIKPCEVNRKMLDVDAMLYSISKYTAHYRSTTLPDTYTGSIVRIYTDDVHAGYVRLIREKDNTELQLSDLHSMIGDVTQHGPAILKNYLRTKYYPSNDIEKRKFIMFIDLVFALHSPYWPVEAAEWITRRRPSGFPSKSVIKRVVRYGCDFVQASHKPIQPGANDWRFSFSKAELLIIKTWRIAQRIIYRTLWVLNKKMASDRLCSYYFKTLMFWACEEKPTQFWRNESFVPSVCELLIEMMKWVKIKFCANYFIPGNNMMDHLIDTDLSYEIDTLWKTSQSFQLISDIIMTCCECEIFSYKCMIRIESLTWINRVFVINWRVDNDIDNYTDLCNTNSITPFQNALYAELSDIYRGLCFQQKSANCLIVSDRHTSVSWSVNVICYSLSICLHHMKEH